MIRQILYRSGQLHEFTESDMGRLLQQSRAHNARRGIGGMLMLRDGLFLQLLEGPVAAVDALFAKIAFDPRHCEVRLLARDLRHAPLLPDCPLAWAETSPDTDGVAFAGLKTDTRALATLERATGHPLVPTMQAFLHGAPVSGGGLMPASAWSAR